MGESNNAAGTGPRAGLGDAVSELEEATPVDGRAARRSRNREAVLDAVIELFLEDQMLPSAADVAARSEVSLRSVYRYFDDVEDLVRAAIGRHVERHEDDFVIEGLGTGDLEDRIETLVRVRLSLYETLAPAVRAAVAREHTIPPGHTVPPLGPQLARRRQALTDQAAAMFAPELAQLPAREADERLAAVDALTQFDGLEFLCRHRGMSIRAARGVLVTALRRLLTA
jgi:AcrR family transcriptional regulator